MKTPIETVLRDRYPEMFRFIDAGECGLWYSPRLRLFSLQVRSSSRWVGQTIHYCPFTGAALPKDLSEEFFDALEAMGLHDGLADADKAPFEFQSEAWWIKRGL